MGECAEMVLDGILDWDGSYSGNNETRYLYRNNERLYSVLKLLQSMGVKKDNRYPFIMEYGATIGKDTASQTAKFICAGSDKTNWNAFKRWIKETHKMQCKYLNQ
jgi:hypothetical protein